MAGCEGSEGLDWHAARPGLVRFLARRTGCAATAEDLAQDLWLRLQPSPLAETQAIRHPLAYLFRAAANLAFDWRRREARRTAAGSIDEGVACVDERPSPEREVLARDAAALLRQAIEALPPKCREAFLLCRVEGLTMREAGLRMGVSQRTIENHLAKATLHCRRTLIDAGAWP